MKTIYLAAPLFSEAEINYNNFIADKIRSTFGDKVSLYNPCENSEINDKSQYADSGEIFQADKVHLDDADILIASLDGLVIDPGVAAEIGYYYTKERPILGLYTDSRQGHNDNQLKIDALEEVGESQFSYVNLFVVGQLKERGPIIQSTDELIYELSILLEDE